MTTKSITPAQLEELRQQGEPIELIDVRTPVEFREMHVPFAHNKPLDSIDPRAFMAERNGRLEQPLYVMCQTGSRGQRACDKFANNGFDNIFNIEGGVLAWEARGLSVERGRKAVSLERQVRIAAGSLVLVGAILGFFYPPFIFLSAFVGAGLVFAGITDTCGMGLLLAKMPWNQVKTSCTAPSTLVEKAEHR